MQTTFYNLSQLTASFSQYQIVPQISVLLTFWAKVFGSWLKTDAILKMKDQSFIR